MENLKNYTDEQLREELKRRALEKRKSQKKEIVYQEFDATIISINNRFGYKCNGDVKYKPLVFWKYRVKVCDYSYSFARINKHIDEFYLKQGFFKRDNAPQVGDVVKLRYRRTKGHEIFDLQKAKIVEIIKKAV